MDKLTSLLKLTGYILAFIVSEFLLHYIQTKIEIGTAAKFSLRGMEWLSAAGAIIETTELVFGIEIKVKIKDLFELVWKRCFKSKSTEEADAKNDE